MHGQYLVKANNLEISSYKWLKKSWTMTDTEMFPLTTPDATINHKVIWMKGPGEKLSNAA